MRGGGFRQQSLAGRRGHELCIQSLDERAQFARRRAGATAGNDQRPARTVQAPCRTLDQHRIGSGERGIKIEALRDGRGALGQQIERDFDIGRTRP